MVPIVLAAILAVVAIASTVVGHQLLTRGSAPVAAASVPGDCPGLVPNFAHPALAVAGTTLSPGQAQQITANWFRVRDVARCINDNFMLQTLETGAALTVDTAVTREIECGCQPAKEFHHLKQVYVVVPPAPVRTFLAQIVATRADNEKAVLYTVIFSATGPQWKVTLITQDDHYTTPYITAPGHGGPALAPAAARQELADLGSYLFHWRLTGTAPAIPPRWTGVAATTGAQISAGGQNQINPQTQVYSHWSQPAPASPTYSFPVGAGSVVCGTETSTATDWATTQLYQDPGQRNWGTTLAPGIYPALRETFENQVCVVNHADSARELTAYYGSEISVAPSKRP